MRLFLVGALMSVVSGRALRSLDAQSPSYVRIAYYDTWSRYRASPYEIFPEDINSTLHTHVICAFGSITSDFKLSSNDPEDPSIWARVAAHIRATSPSTKTMVAVGGWSFNDGPTRYYFSNMVGSAANRATFIQSVLEVSASLGLQGLDIDWEYPADPDRGGRPEDKQNLATFVAELRQAAPEDFVISMAVPASIWASERAYDRAALNASLTYVNIMAYDMQDSNVLSPHSALYNYSTSASDIVAWWREEASPSKLVLGIPAYAHTFTMAPGTIPAYGQPANGPGTPGRYTQQAGILSYYESEELGPFTHDPATETAFVSNENQFATLDDLTAVAQKAEWIRAQGLAGAMVWTISLDDRLKEFPILTTIKKHLT